MNDIITESGYTIKLLDFNDNEESLKKILNLQNIVYEGQHVFHIEPFRNWYLNNPMGKVISFNAFYGDELVAHYACSPYKMLIEGREVLGLFDLATVTHPDHRGKGLFKLLAKSTFDYAKQQGFEFVLGVANANSFPGYMKYFPFTFVGQLEVRVGFGANVIKNGDKAFSVLWDQQTINWRRTCCKGNYWREKNGIVGNYNRYVQTLMGTFNPNVLGDFGLDKKTSMKPKLYVGFGAKFNSPYFKVPRWVKHSPFNLIFLDLTDGTLPKMTKDNVFFQLFDFDVA